MPNCLGLGRCDKGIATEAEYFEGTYIRNFVIQFEGLPYLFNRYIPFMNP